MAKPSSRFGVEIQVEDLPDYYRRLRALPKAAQEEMRWAAQAIADDEAVRIRRRAASDSAQASAITTFIKARRDRVPSISAGGMRRAGVSGGAKAGEIFFGAEFGGGARKTTRQFRPHKGREGYFFFPQLRADQARQIERYEAALRNIEREWSRG